MPAASEPSKGVRHDSLPTAVTLLSSSTHSPTAQATAAEKPSRPSGQLPDFLNTPVEPLTHQEGLARAYSAPALSAALNPFHASSEGLLSSMKEYRDQSQHAKTSLDAAAEQHCSASQPKATRKVQGNSEPKIPGIEDRQAWCNTFNPPRQHATRQRRTATNEPKTASSLAGHKQERHQESTLQSGSGAESCTRTAGDDDGHAALLTASTIAVAGDPDTTGTVWCVSQQDESACIAPLLNLGKSFMFKYQQLCHRLWCTASHSDKAVKSCQRWRLHALKLQAIQFLDFLTGWIGARCQITG